MQSKRFILLIMVISFCTLARAQKIALKNNLLMDGMASPNLGVEFKVGVRTTLDVPVSWNLWSFSNDKKSSILPCSRNYGGGNVNRSRDISWVFTLITLLITREVSDLSER